MTSLRRAARKLQREEEQRRRKAEAAGAFFRGRKFTIELALVRDALAHAQFGSDVAELGTIISAQMATGDGDWGCLVCEQRWAPDRRVGIIAMLEGLQHPDTHGIIYAVCEACAALANRQDAILRAIEHQFSAKPGSAQRIHKEGRA